MDISLSQFITREKSGLKCEPYSRQLSHLGSSDLGSNFSTLQVKYVCRNSSNCKNPAGLLCCHLQCVFVGILSQSCLFGDLSSQKLICKGQITSDLLPEGCKSLLSTSGFQENKRVTLGRYDMRKVLTARNFLQPWSPWKYGCRGLGVEVSCHQSSRKSWPQPFFTLLLLTGECLLSTEFPPPTATSPKPRTCTESPFSAGRGGSSL